MSDDAFNLRHLRYFLAVADAGSFRAASAQLNIAQSAVSRRVADLEASFGVQLFERRPRGVALSDAGVALRAGARRIAAELDDARDAVLRTARGEDGELRVGLYGSISQLAFVPPLIARFRDACPGVRLDLSPVADGSVDPASRAGVDVALYEDAQGLDGAHCLLAGQYQAALPRGHHLAALPAIPFASLCEAELIAFPATASPAAHDALIGAAAAQGRALNILHETASECARLALAAAGMGIAIVSPLAAAHDQGFAVDYRALVGIAVPFELWLSVRPGAPAAAMRFAELAGEVVAGLTRSFPRPLPLG